MKICVKDLSGLDCQLRCYWRLFINFPIVMITISRIIVIIIIIIVIVIIIIIIIIIISFIDIF